MNVRGDIYLKGQEFPAAERWAHEVICHHPKRINGYIILGDALVGQHRNGEAVQAYSKAIALEPKIGGVHAYLSLALEAVGDSKAALRAAETAVHLDPELHSAEWERRKLVRALIQRVRREQAAT